jgi:hemerythrin superfamily protein
MNIYETLKQEHKKVANLMDRLVQSSTDGGEKWKELADEIRDELIPHSRAEEAILYNAMRESEHGNAVVAHGYGEHAKAEIELRTLLAMKSIDMNWTALARKLRDDLTHHVAEEEDKIFKSAQEIFTEEEAVMMAEAFVKLKATVKEQSFVGTTMDLITNMLPPRLMAGFKKHFPDSPQPRV